MFWPGGNPQPISHEVQRMSQLINKRLHIGKTGLIIIGLLVVCAVYLLWPVRTLQIRSGNQNSDFKLALTLFPESKVAVGFVHSLYKVKQEERYVIREGQLRLTSVFFGSRDALNYYDPLELFPQNKVAGGYEVSLDIPITSPVCFAVAHSTPMWLKIDGGTPIPLEHFSGQDHGFSMQMAWQPRALARLN